ncbi:hypothetical protein [Parasitella parasitica]|uniref:Uncharacterized protein n=1 Tax=Parasitella parasitica TaxID=35722 RepID=A0A0B7N4K7_9FUNG|nr:hypothetical protein [Parasitella parasitica]
MGKVNTTKTKSFQCEYPYSKHAFPKEEATENAIISASTDEMMELDEPTSDVEENNPKEVDDERIEFNVNYSDNWRDDFAESELYSMKLKQILEQYSIPTQAGRDITYFIRSMIKRTQKATKAGKCDIAPTNLSQDTLDAVLKKKLPIKYDDLNVCHNGCIVFSENMSECDRCKKDNSKSPKRKSKTMKMLNIGSQIATMLCDKQTRELMEYPRKEF